MPHLASVTRDSTKLWTWPCAWSAPGSAAAVLNSTKYRKSTGSGKRGGDEVTSVTMVSLPALHVQGMDDVEQKLTDKLLSQLLRKAPYNRIRELYYDGNDTINSLGIAVPQLLDDVRTVVGWPGMAVNSLEERLDWQGVALL